MPSPSDKSDSSTSASGGTESLDATVASLTNFLSDDFDNLPSEEADKDLATLFRYLESANTVASGVESRLDGLLANLDNMLQRLEPIAAETKSDSGNEIGQADDQGDIKSEEKKEPFINSNDRTKS